jgi:hypothetical protein
MVDTASAVVGPATQAASQVSLAMSPHELILLIGSVRSTLNAATGQPTGGVLPDWTAAYSLSPTTAKNLMIGLQVTLAQYEEKFGKIPTDPTHKIEVTSPANP